MWPRVWGLVFLLAVVAGSAAAQSQVRLDPRIDGRIHTRPSFPPISTAYPFLYGPSVINVGRSGYIPGHSDRYVIKFDVSGIDLLLDARLVVYFPNLYYPDAMYLAWGNGSNQSGSPSTVNAADIPFSPIGTHLLLYEGGLIPPQPGLPYYGAYWNITDELIADLPSGHSDFVIGLLPIGQGPGYQPMFTTHLGQPGGGDGQGSPFGPHILYTPAPIPEPGTLVLLGLGLVSFGVAYRRRRRKAA